MFRFSLDMAGRRAIINRMKSLIAAVCALLLCSGGANAQETQGIAGSPHSFLIFPSWYEVVDIINQGKTKDGDVTPEPGKGALRPYLGVNDISPSAYLIPGNLLDVSGGLSYYVPRTGKAGSVGMIFAVKDRISNRLVGYSFEPANLTTYFSLSISY